MTTIRISELRSAEGDASGDVVSLAGPTNVVAGTSNTYTITDYDDFSVYTVQTSVGTVAISDDTITLDVPGGATGNIVLTVRRNTTSRMFQIAIGASAIATPNIISPLNGATNIPTTVTLQATAFTSVPAGLDTQKNSQWQIARDSGFTDIIDGGVVNTGNMSVFTANDLPHNTQIYARVRYEGNTLGVSAWSNTITFLTTNQQINQPTVSIVGNSVDVNETPTFNSSAFSVTPVGSDTHVASSWVIRLASDNSVVWQLINSSVNKTSVTIPQGVLSTSTQYTIEVQHIGGFGSSMFSEKLTFTTAATFVPNTPGTPFGGGYYAGRINIDGQIYALVVAPRSLGGQAPGTLTWKTSQTTTAGANSVNDGLANTQAMATAGLANHPAAQFCRGLSIGGYSDWYLPAKDELEILYRNFKPTTNINSTGSGANSNSVPPTSNYTSGNPAQTSVALFKTGAAEAFQADRYWSSTEFSSLYGWNQDFNGGGQYGNYKTNTYYVRAVRRVLVS